MSVHKNLAGDPAKDAVVAGAGAGSGGGAGQRQRFDQAYSGLEIQYVDSGPLSSLDPEKLKREIQKWAKAVVAYARQLSFGSQEKSEK